MKMAASQMKVFRRGMRQSIIMRRSIQHFCVAVAVVVTLPCLVGQTFDKSTATLTQTVGESTATPGQTVDQSTATPGQTVGESTATLTQMADKSTATTTQTVNESTATTTQTVNQSTATPAQTVDQSTATLAQTVDESTATLTQTVDQPKATPAATPFPSPVVPPPSTFSTAFPHLGAAGKYAVLSLSQTYQNQSLVTINGDVGVGPNGTAITQAPSVVNGTVYVDPTATYTNKGTVTGIPPVIVKSMMQEVTDANTASNFYASLNGGGNTMFSTINQATSIQGGLTPTIAPLVIGDGNNYYVFNLSGGINLNNANLTITGGSNDYFVFNIQPTGGFNLVGNASIVLNGISESHVLFNVLGTGSTLMTNVGDTIRGTILAVQRTITFDGVFVGEIIGGGSSLTLLSGANVNSPSPPSVPDAGSTFLLSAIALAALYALRVLGNQRSMIKSVRN
jgi:hypothetical protein